MKKLVVIALAIVAVSCNGIIGNGFKISGAIEGVADGTQVFLEKQDAEKGMVVTLDTAKVEKGKFVFEGKAEEPEIGGIRFDKLPGGFAVVVEKGNIDVTVKKDSIGKAKVSGTYNNDELGKYLDMLNVIQKKMMVFQQKNMPVMQAAQQKNDTVTMNRLNKEFMGIQKETVAANEKYITDSPKSFLSILLVEGMFNQQSDAAKITAFYDALDSDIKATKPGKRVAKKIAELKKYKDSQKKTEVGQIAPDFSAKNPEGKVVSLKQSLGKLTIIDFWASWCRPCREGNPAMVALYNEYHPKGLNIIGVSLDKEGAAKEWKDAIAKDQLAWIHVSNLKFWDEPISKLYAIQSIPTAYLLDANGRIIAKDLQGEALKKKVAELLP